jgi:hypothetical protein
VRLAGCIAAAAAALAGCAIDAPDSGLTRFELSWSIASGTCDTIDAVTVRAVMAHGDPGDEFVDDFACADGHGVTHVIEPDVRYGVRLLALDAAGVEVGVSETREEQPLARGTTTVLDPFTIDTSTP